MTCSHGEKGKIEAKLRGGKSHHFRSFVFPWHFPSLSEMMEVISRQFDCPHPWLPVGTVCPMSHPWPPATLVCCDPLRCAGSLCKAKGTPGCAGGCPGVPCCPQLSPCCHWDLPATLRGPPPPRGCPCVPERLPCDCRPQGLATPVPLSAVFVCQQEAGTKESRAGGGDKEEEREER